MLARRELPAREHLVDYNHAVAGHEGTMSDPDGELFIKPCVQAEINFYNSVRRRHPDFAEIMPEFLGTLTLSDPADLSSIEEADGVVAPAVVDAEAAAEPGENLVERIAEQAAALAAAVGLTTREESPPLPSVRAAVAGAAAATMMVPRTADVLEKEKDNITWVPSKSKKIKTDTAVVLENAAAGFRQPNILDVKLGVRLWADDAPLQKKQRFDKISAETTHRDFGFRIAGMRVWRGSRDAADLNADGFRVFDKDYGRVVVNNDNVADALRGFVFSEAAGVDDDLARAVCAAFARDVRRVERVLAANETRMYSASLLFVFEGDGDALRAAVAANNAAIEAAEARLERVAAARAAKGDAPARTAARIDSGIGMDDLDDLDEQLGGLEDEDDDEDDDEPALPKIYAVRLIDFAHAQWTPGMGPDENSLKGVRSLARIFEDLASS